MSTFFTLSVLFALMQMAISKGKEAHLTTAASASTPMPNLEIVLHDLGNFCLMPSDGSHVRVRICVNEGIRFLVEYIDPTSKAEKFFSAKVDLSKFWDGCPYQNLSNDDIAYEVSVSDAENMLRWVLKRAENIQHAWDDDLIEKVYI